MDGNKNWVLEYNGVQKKTVEQKNSKPPLPKGLPPAGRRCYWQPGYIDLEHLSLGVPDQHLTNPPT